jgi:hypothetical protein
VTSRKYNHPEIQKLRDAVVLALIITNVITGGVLIGVMVYLTNQFGFMLLHWKP